MADERSGERGSALRNLSDVASSAIERTVRWTDTLDERAGSRRPPHDLILGGSGDAESVEFTQRLLDLLFGGDDAFTAADGLRDMSRDVPESLSPRDRLMVRAGGAASLSLPWAVMPLAKRWLRDRVAHLVLVTRLPESRAQLDRRSRAMMFGGLFSAIRRHEAETSRRTVALAPRGDRVHGPHAAEAELERLVALASLPEVSRLVVDPARLVPGGNDWSAGDDTAQAAMLLQGLLEACLEHGTALSLEPTSARWARLGPEVLIRGSADARFDEVRLGIRLPAEFPESREAAERLIRWGRERKRDGGEPLDIVLGHVGLIGNERIASIQSGLAVPVLDRRDEVEAQLLRLAGLLLRAGDAGIRTVLASESVPLIATAYELAERTGGSDDRFAVRVRAGVASELTHLLVESGIDVHIHLPATVPDELGGAVDTLVALAAESAERTVQEADPEAESTGERLERILALADEPFPESHRTQLRSREWHPSERDSALFYRAPDEPARHSTAGLTAAVLGLGRTETGEITLEDKGSPLTIPVRSASGFANEPATDASIAANREWAASIVDQAQEEQSVALGATVDPGDVQDVQDVAERRGEPHDTVELERSSLMPDAEAVIEAARDAQLGWGAQPPKTRALRLRRAALGAAAARDRLMLHLVRDTGGTIPSIDAQIGDIVDAARYAGQLAEGLASIRGAEFLPGGLTLVTADPETTLAEQAEQVLAALGAGCSVLWATPLPATASVLVEEWEAAGLTPGAVALVPDAGSSDPEIPDDPWLLRLIGGVDRVCVLGDRELARTVQRRRPDLRIEGVRRTTGAAIVTPAAASDDAVHDLAVSAFTGARSRRVQAAILVGRTARSRGFRDRLADAVRALRVGDTRTSAGADPLGLTVGPLPAPPDERGLRALTELERGEEWVLEPAQLDEAGLLWSPGIRTGVAPTSPFWEDARGMPVLGLVRARSMAEAIRMQNRIGGGSHASLHSLDADEIGPWLEKSDAAFLAINRPTTAVRIERQPVGAWGDAAIGMPSLAGGPNRLITLGSWRVRPGTRSSTLHLHGLDPEVQVLIEASQEVLGYEEFDEVRRAALADALAWRTKFGLFEDAIGLGVERNALRYWPVTTQLRLSEGAPLAQLLRVLAAALLVRARVTVSTGEVLPSPVATFLATQGISISLERDEDWLERLSVSGATDGREVIAERVRLIGGDRAQVAEWMTGQDHLTLWAEPVTMAGPVELFSLLREQSISARAHRHGIATTVPELDDRLG